jgi:hypothetical protein
LSSDASRDDFFARRQFIFRELVEKNFVFGNETQSRKSEFWTEPPTHRTVSADCDVAKSAISRFCHFGFDIFAIDYYGLSEKDKCAPIENIKIFFFANFKNLSCGVSF